MAWFFEKLFGKKKKEEPIKSGSGADIIRTYSGDKTSVTTIGGPATGGPGMDMTHGVVTARPTKVFGFNGDEIITDQEELIFKSDQEYFEELVHTRVKSKTRGPKKLNKGLTEKVKRKGRKNANSNIK